MTIDDPVLHVCGGMARLYPYKGGFGPHDLTLDMDPKTEPDHMWDARDSFPPRGVLFDSGGPHGSTRTWPERWPAILIDPPYSEADAEHYGPGVAAYPKPNLLMKNAMEAVRPGGRVGIIHYMLPQVKGAKFVAAVGVICGFNNRIRIYSVFEKPI